VQLFHYLFSALCLKSRKSDDHCHFVTLGVQVNIPVLAKRAPMFQTTIHTQTQ